MNWSELDETASADEAAGADEVVVSAGGGAVGRRFACDRARGRRRGMSGEAQVAPARRAQPARRGIRGPDGRAARRVLFSNAFGLIFRACCDVAASRSARPGTTPVLDILAARAAAVVVPFAAERETEQRLRAERLAVRGAIEMVTEASCRRSGSAERSIGRSPAARQRSRSTPAGAGDPRRQSLG